MDILDIFLDILLKPPQTYIGLFFLLVPCQGTGDIMYPYPFCVCLCVWRRVVLLYFCVPFGSHVYILTAGKLMFSQASVILFTGGGGGLCVARQGGHGTGKTGNLVLTFSRQGKHREFGFGTGKNFETQGKCFSVTQGKF